MAYEILVGLYVKDEDGYQKYREGMRPILETYGGTFSYDFRVSEVLRSQTEHAINRVFTIRFPDETARTAFFADAAYLKVRAQFFDASVSGVTTIATYETDRPPL